jgi:hypothetical protein
MKTHLKTILALITLIGIATLVVYYPIILVIFTIFILYVWLYIFFNGGITY